MGGPSPWTVRARRGLPSQIATELTRRTHGGRSAPAPVRRPATVRPRVSLPPRRLAGSHARSFSDEQLAAGIRAVGESVGHAPTGGDYRRLAPTLGLASHATVCIRFGSWLGALRAAGFEPAASKRAYAKKWDAQACREALERVADELGEFPRYRDYEQLAAGREDLPSAALLRQRLGRWSQIAAELGERRGADGIPEVVHEAA